MKRATIVFCFASLSLIAWSVSDAIAQIMKTEIGLPLLRNYDPKEYGFAPQVWCIFQDKRGMLYYGLSETGIIEYDGHTWRKSATLNTVYDIKMDSQGVMYVGCFNDYGYLDEDALGQTKFKSLKSDTARIAAVWTVKVNGNKVYFHSYPAIFEYDLGTKTTKKFSAPVGHQFNGAFLHQGAYYIWLSENGLMRIRDGVLEPAPHSDLLKSKNYRATLNLKNNKKVLLTSEQGLWSYTPDTNVPPAPISLSDADFIKENVLYTGQTLTNKYHIVGSKAKGALLIDDFGQELNRYNEQSGLRVNGVIASSQDYNGNIWLGLNVGFSKTEHGQDLSAWSKQNNLKESVYNIIRFKGKLYIATSSGCYFLDNNRVAPIAGLNKGRQYWTFHKFSHHGDSLLLLGTADGLFQIKGETATVIRQGSHCAALFQSRKNPYRLYARDGDKFISLRYENKKWIDEGTWQGVEESFRGIQEDADGTLWLGTLSNGIVRIVPNQNSITQPKAVTYFSIKDGLPSKIRCRPFEYNNKIIFGTEQGLRQFNSATQQFEPYCELGRMFCDGSTEVFLFTIANNGRIYTSPLNNKKGGIGYLKKNDAGNFDWTYKPFRRFPELAIINSQWLDDDGTYWIGSNEGLYKYDEREDTKNYELPFTCLMRQVSINRDSVIFHGGLGGITASHREDLKYGFNDIVFEFAAPFFDQEENTKYSYQLLGYDESWSPWSKEYSKEYTNLKEGSYTFQVKAMNIYDKVSSVATYSFVVAPPWFRTWWAYSLYAIGLALAVFGYANWRTWSLKNEKIALEKIVLARTNELNKANQELRQSEEELKQNNEELITVNEKLSATLETLSKAQQQLVESEKMASLGQLTAGIAHEINNPVNFISGGIQVLTSIQTRLLDHGHELTPEELDEIRTDITALMKTINTGVTRTTAVIASLRTFSSSSVDIDEHSSLDVRESINNTLLLLNSKIQDANVSIIKEFKHKSGAKANEAQIGQVILNIVDNAIYALKKTVDHKVVTITTEETLEHILIKIKDNGEGISKENQSQILNPFFTTKEVGKGTGLGLSICYGIIQRHNGKLSFTSELNKGTEFCIAIPKASML